MGRNYFSEPLITQTADGSALTASTTPTSILHPAAVFTLPANFFEVGRKIRVSASGRISTVVTTPGTLTLDLMFGGVIVATSGAMALNVVAKTNVPWHLEWDLTCRAIGASTSANLMHQGKWFSEAVIGSALPSAGGAGVHLLPNATPAVGTGFSSVATQAVNLFATWSINNADSILCHQYELTAIN
jgi:hypothetical protein